MSYQLSPLVLGDFWIVKLLLDIVRCLSQVVVGNGMSPIYGEKRQGCVESTFFWFGMIR